MATALSARSATEQAARDAYGRLVARLARHGDLAAAEDAVADALEAALTTWERTGVPTSPEAWLVTVARRRLIDRARKQARANRIHGELARVQDEITEAVWRDRPFPDERLALMLACAHPAVDASARTPLMLQLVLGVSAERMASAYLMSPSAMTKRLVRAKAKLSLSGVRFALPEPETLEARLQPLLDAIYVAFTLGDAELGGSDLVREALWLGRLVVQLRPDTPEAMGLLALMLFVSARRDAQRAAGFTPLADQDTGLWNESLLAEAEGLLKTAGRLHRHGRFQIEAAIQAVHADRRRTGSTDWAAIALLYDGLVKMSPALGAMVAQAGAMAHSGQPGWALALLDAIAHGPVSDHQPYWATRAYVLAQLNRQGEAAVAYQRAAGLTNHEPVRRWLMARRADLTP